MHDNDAIASVWMMIADEAEKLRRVLVPFELIAEKTGLGLAAIDSAVFELAGIEMLQCFNADGRSIALLTERSAADLGLQLRRIDGKRPGLSWMRARGDKLKKGRSVREADLGTGLDYFAGNVATPDAYAIAHESAALQLGAPPERSKRRLSDRELDPDRLPRPRVLLMGCQPWDAVWRPICPACRGAKMASVDFCLRCDRWGLDWLIGRIEADAARAVAVEPPRREMAERVARPTTATAK